MQKNIKHISLSSVNLSFKFIIVCLIVLVSAIFFIYQIFLNNEHEIESTQLNNEHEIESTQHQPKIESNEYTAKTEPTQHQPETCIFTFKYDQAKQIIEQFQYVKEKYPIPYFMRNFKPTYIDLIVPFDKEKLYEFIEFAEGLKRNYICRKEEQYYFGYILPEYICTQILKKYPESVGIDYRHIDYGFGYEKCLKIPFNEELFQILKYIESIR